MHHQSGIKVFFGKIILTRRMYLIYFMAGLVAAAGLWFCLHTILGPDSYFGRNIDLLVPWFYDFVNWFFIVAIIIHLVEAMYLSRKFREREEFLLRERGEQYTDQLRG